MTVMSVPRQAFSFASAKRAENKYYALKQFGNVNRLVIVIIIIIKKR